MDQIALLYTTWPDAETAERAAEAAVAARLAACVNILGSGRSIYRWQGVIERADEIVAMFKTTAGKAQALNRLIVDHHPYDTPAVVRLEVAETGSNPDFLAWIGQQTA